MNVIVYIIIYTSFFSLLFYKLRIICIKYTKMRKVNSLSLVEQIDASQINIEFESANEYNSVTYIPISITKRMKKYPNASYETDVKCRFSLQTPRLFSPFGASAFNADDKTPHPNWAVQMSCEPESQILKFLQELDERIMTLCANNDKFLKQLDINKKKRSGAEKTIEDILDSVSEKYSRIVKMGAKIKNSENCYPPTFKAKIVRNKYKKIETFCKAGKEIIELEDDNIQDAIPKQCMCRCVVLFPQLWVINRSFGVTCKLMSIRVFPPQNIGREFSFLPCSDDEEEGATQEESKEQCEENDNSNSKSMAPPPPSPVSDEDNDEEEFEDGY